MIPLNNLAGLVGEPLVYESFRTISERGVQDDFRIATTAPLLVSGADPSGAQVASLVGGTATLRNSPTTLGLEIPLKTIYGGTGGVGPWTSGSVIFIGSTGNFAQDNSAFFYDFPNHRLGLGTAVPNAVLDVRGKMRVGDDSHNNYPADNPVFYFATAATNVVGNWTATNAGANGAQFTMRADGNGAGNKMVSGNVLGLIGFRGKDDVGFAGTSSGMVTASATETWSSTAHGTKLFFDVTPNGSTARATAVTIDQSGYVGIGQTSPQQNLDVNGRIALANSGSSLTAGAQLLTRVNNDQNWGISNTQAAGTGTDQYHVRVHGGGAATRWKRQFQVIDSGASNAVRFGVNFDGTGANGVFQDMGGAVFNVMAYPYGAIGDGSTDDTTAINNAISAAEAATAPGIVYLPSGYKFKTTGNHTITTCSVIGGGPGTVIKLEHATNDLFVIATATSNRSDISIGNFQVTSATTRTSGWVIKYAPAYNAGFGIVRSRFFNITMQNQFNGIWIAAYEYDWMDSCIYDNPSTTGTTGSTAFKFGQTASTNINQGSEFYVSNCQSNNRGQASNSYGFWIEDCDAIYFKGCGAMAYLNSFTMTNTGHGCSNHFWTQVVADVTSNSTANNHSCWIKGTQQNVNNVITNSWFAAAQGGSDGLHIDAGAAQLWNITNSIFYNCSRYGLYAKDARILVHGNTFWGNTTADFYVDATNNTTNCGQYNGNYSYNGTASWITSANSAKCGFNGNYYATAPTYGVAAAQNVNNITY